MSEPSDRAIGRQADYMRADSMTSELASHFAEVRAEGIAQGMAECAATHFSSEVFAAMHAEIESLNQAKGRAEERAKIVNDLRKMRHDGLAQHYMRGEHETNGGEK